MEVKGIPTRRETKYRIVQIGSDPGMGIQGKHVLMEGAGERRSKPGWNERRRTLFVSTE